MSVTEPCLRIPLNPTESTGWQRARLRNQCNTKGVFDAHAAIPEAYSLDIAHLLQPCTMYYVLCTRLHHVPCTVRNVVSLSNTHDTQTRAFSISQAKTICCRQLKHAPYIHIPFMHPSLSKGILEELPYPIDLITAWLGIWIPHHTPLLCLCYSLSLPVLQPLSATVPLCPALSVCTVPSGLACSLPAFPPSHQNPGLPPSTTLHPCSIGIYTGDVMAAVVGRRMPHMALIGE